MTDTLPSSDSNDVAVQVDASFTDNRTGALFVHKDLVKIRDDWQVAPPKANEQLGDVTSWAAYVKRFGLHQQPLLTWNSSGLHAVLDYHQNVGLEGGPGRLQWFAHHPFDLSPEWRAWQDIASGHAIPQRRAVEQLEDRGAEIVDPPQAELMNLLRNLRTTVNATAQTELLPNGTTRVGFSRDTAVKGISDVELPSEFSIAIPVLRGHPDVYKLTVKVRASVDDQAHLTLRFAIPNAERTLEAVYADRVGEARKILGDGFEVLRAAG